MKKLSQHQMDIDCCLVGVHATSNLKAAVHTVHIFVNNFGDLWNNSRQYGEILVLDMSIIHF